MGGRLGFGCPVFDSPLFGLTTAGAAALPPALLDALASWVVTAAPSGWQERRAGHRAAVRRVLELPDSGDAAARSAVLAHARFVAEFLAVLGGRIHTLEGGEELDAVAPGRGRLLTMVHEGNWIAVGRRLAPRIGPIHTVAGVQLGAGWQRKIDATLREQGIVVHHPPFAARRLLGVLRDGGTVALHLDGDQGRATGAATPGVRAAAALALRTDAAVFHVRTKRVAPGRFRFVPQPLTCGSPNRAQTVEEWERIFAERVRESVADAPGDWMVFRP